MSSRTEYNCWNGMIQRCQKEYRYYERGIKVCKRWTLFKNFIADMGKKPSPSHSIDRIDNNGDYKPSNCRWATVIQQNNNRRSNKWITYRGETRSLADWCRKLNLPYMSMRNRLFKNEKFESAISRPFTKEESLAYQRKRAATNMPGAKLNKNQVLDIRKRLDRGVGVKTLSTEYGVCLDTITNIEKRKTWRTI